MREAVGGTVLFYIILGFLGIFIIFIAIIMNYAAAYRTNNYVVNMIEQTEGQKPLNNGSDSLVSWLKKNNYNNGLKVSCSANDKGSVFHVTTYINFYIPIIEVGFPLEINNDTKTIFKKYGSQFCDVDVYNNAKDYKSVGCWPGETNNALGCK